MPQGSTCLFPQITGVYPVSAHQALYTGSGNWTWVLRVTRECFHQQNHFFIALNPFWLWTLLRISARSSQLCSHESHPLEFFRHNQLSDAYGFEDSLCFFPSKFWSNSKMEGTSISNLALSCEPVGDLTLRRYPHAGQGTTEHINLWCRNLTSAPPELKANFLLQILTL